MQFAEKSLDIFIDGTAKVLQNAAKKRNERRANRKLRKTNKQTNNQT